MQIADGHGTFRSGEIHKIAILLIAGICIVFLEGCAWERKAIFEAASQRASIEIQQPFPVNGWGTRVLLIENRKTTILYEFRGDAFLDFADVVWTASGEKVTVLTLGTPSIRLSYDLAGKSFLPFAPMEAMLAEHVRSEYDLNGRKMTDEEVLQWAWSPEAKQAFLRRHPSAAPRQ